MDPEVVAVATGAAANLTSGMLQATWPRTRAGLARLLSHCSDEQRGQALARADEDQMTLTGASPTSFEEARERWEDYFEAFARQYPGALPELRLLAASTPVVVQVQRNEGSGTFIGGNVNGGLTIHQGGSGGNTTN